MPKVPVIDMSDYDKKGCLDEIFKIQAGATPNSIAVVDVDGSTVNLINSVKSKCLVNCYSNFRLRTRI